MMSIPWRCISMNDSVSAASLSPLMHKTRIGCSLAKLTEASAVGSTFDTSSVKVGSASANFDGNDYVSAPTIAQIGDPTGIDISFSIWFYPTDASGYRYLLSSGAQSSVGTGITIYQESGHCRPLIRRLLPAGLIRTSPHPAG